MMVRWLLFVFWRVGWQELRCSHRLCLCSGTLWRPVQCLVVGLGALVWRDPTLHGRRSFGETASSPELKLSEGVSVGLQIACRGSLYVGPITVESKKNQASTHARREACDGSQQREPEEPEQGHREITSVEATSKQGQAQAATPKATKARPTNTRSRKSRPQRPHA